MNRYRSHIILAAMALSLPLVGCRDHPDHPLTIASAEGRTDDVRALIGHGVDVNLKDGTNLTALIWASRGGHTATVRALLESGADPNASGGVNDWPPLIHAIHKGQNAVALILLDAGADVKNRDGAAALLMAAGYGNADMTRLLLERGADPRFASGGATVLSNAVGGAWDIDYQWTGCEPHTNTVRALLEKAPDLKLPDSAAGRLALKYAKLKGCSELVSLVDKN